MNIEIRKTTESDIVPVVGFVRATGFFRENENEIALEVITDAVYGHDESYQSYTAVLDDEPVGWIMFGETPCTVKTYDIYWIAVSPHCQKGGVGSRLMKFAEEMIRQQGGRLSVIETSGTDTYAPTQQFYYKNGYELAATVRDFYDRNDHKLIFTKHLT